MLRLGLPAAFSHCFEAVIAMVGQLFKLHNDHRHLRSAAILPDEVYIQGCNFTDYPVRAPIIKNTDHLHHACSSNDPIIITNDAWIVHVKTRTIISKLPPTVLVKRYMASNRSITIATEDESSSLFALHFPPTELTSPGTWNPPVYETGDHDSDMDVDE
jgi:hypothetical protein